MNRKTGFLVKVLTDFSKRVKIKTSLLPLKDVNFPKII